MEDVTIKLERETLEKAIHLAKSRHCSLSKLITEVINLLADPNVINDPIMGMVADEPELADTIIKQVEESRQQINA